MTECMIALEISTFLVPGISMTTWRMPLFFMNALNSGEKSFFTRELEVDQQPEVVTTVEESYITVFKPSVSRK